MVGAAKELVWSSLLLGGCIAQVQPHCAAALAHFCGIQSKSGGSACATSLAPA